MFGFLSRYIFYHFFFSTCVLFLVFAPVVFSIDLLLPVQFDIRLALFKMPFRYGQMLGMLAFVASCFSIKWLFYKHGQWIFISLKYKKHYMLFSLLYLACLISSIFYLLIVPFNDKVFDYRSYVSKWAIVKEKDYALFVYDNQTFYDVWRIEKDFSINNYCLSKSELKLLPSDFYIIWNETKKMSFQRLSEYKAYADKNNFNTDEYYKQLHVNYSRFFVVFAMLLCGVMIADKSIYMCLLCFLCFNWVDLLAFFLPLKYCILVLWTNIFLWFFISLFYFFV